MQWQKPHGRHDILHVMCERGILGMWLGFFRTGEAVKLVFRKK